MCSSVHQQAGGVDGGLKERGATQVYDELPAAAVHHGVRGGRLVRLGRSPGGAQAHQERRQEVTGQPALVQPQEESRHVAVPLPPTARTQR